MLWGRCLRDYGNLKGVRRQRCDCGEARGQRSIANYQVLIAERLSAGAVDIDGA
jgi:hypothetical protein